MRRERLGAATFLILFCLVAIAQPASATIVKTKRLRELALVIGSGIEYESDGDQTEYGFPFLLEFEPSDALGFTFEPSYVSIRDKNAGRTVRGVGDLETTVAWEFLGERRNRPALAVEGSAKWPTAKHEEIGTGKADYSLGGIISKEFVHVDLDLEALYTFVGSPPGVNLRNTFEASLAAEWHLSSFLDLEGEVVTSSGSGSGFRGQPGTLGGLGGLGASEKGGRETEGTLGLAEHLTDHLKLEEGIIYGSDGSWQAVAAWELDFAER
ncbi:MAG: hypothetical protein E6K76_06810 [Candidatus Eisenbacteria bacterium]|uniref:Transporter n=1 Tax=Eiseniibacteriota bacterium TaxID=2212470 RepID=A0A538T5C9_UNCEI|nr:MAG: hypothetical protein E6K76_06810 [Candidatus Eisenbacteria bacterium]